MYTNMCMYVYDNMYVCVCVYIYIYIHVVLAGGSAVLRVVLPLREGLRSAHALITITHNIRTVVITMITIMIMLIILIITSICYIYIYIYAC